MSANVGLSTPRGSGTSGYVQRNLSHLKPRDNIAPYPKDFSDQAHYKQRKPDAELLEHESKRAIELKVFELRCKLEDEDKDEDEIDDECEALRRKLSKEQEKGAGKEAGKSEARRLKGHQVHEQARAKIHEDEKFRRALGIRDDYEEGSHWKRQEERLRDALPAKTKEESRRRPSDEDDEEDDE